MFLVNIVPIRQILVARPTSEPVLCTCARISRAFGQKSGRGKYYYLTFQKKKCQLYTICRHLFIRPDSVITTYHFKFYWLTLSIPPPISFRLCDDRFETISFGRITSHVNCSVRRLTKINIRPGNADEVTPPFRVRHRAFQPSPPRSSPPPLIGRSLVGFTRFFFSTVVWKIAADNRIEVCRRSFWIIVYIVHPTNVRVLFVRVCDCVRTLANVSVAF